MDREDEFKLHSKDYCMMRTDEKTMLSNMAITLIKDIDRGRVVIEEFVDEREEEDLKKGKGKKSKGKGEGEEEEEVREGEDGEES